MRKISKSVIEESGVQEIKKLLSPRYFQDFMKIASTEESFDGYVNFYEDRNCNEKGEMIQVPLQVKSTTDTKRDGRFPIDVPDLENYKINGICYFVVQLRFDPTYTRVEESTIFAKSLIGREVLDLLKDANKQSVTLDFTKIATEEEMRKLFISYKIKQQIVTSHNYVDISKVTQAKITLLDENNEYDVIPQAGKTYFATFTDEGGDVSFAHDFVVEEVHFPVAGEVRVGNKVFFGRFETVDKIGKDEIVLNDALSLELVDSGFKVILNKRASADDYIEAFSFIIDAVSNKSFSLGDQNISILNADDLIKQMKDYYSSYLYVAKLIDKVVKGVKYVKRYSFCDLTKEDFDSIEKLYLNQIDGSVDYYLLHTSLFTKKVARVCSHGHVLFFDFFDENLYSAVKFKLNGDASKRTTPFIYLTDQDWQEMDLSPVERFKAIIINNVSNDDACKKDYKVVVKNLLNAYKKSGRDELFAYAKFLNQHFSFGFDLERILNDFDIE